jgi:hypothetical protein
MRKTLITSLAFFVLSLQIANLSSAQEEGAIGKLLSQPTISNLILKLNNEIRRSQEFEEQMGLTPALQVEGLDLEVYFVVEKGKPEEGGLDLKVVQVGKEAGYPKEALHKVTLHMKRSLLLGQ